MPLIIILPSLMKRNKQRTYVMVLVSGNYCVLNDFNGTFSACLRGFMSEKCPEIKKILVLKFFLLCPGLHNAPLPR